MNTNSNTYTFIYAAVMVIVVAAVLSFTALSLKPKQDKNKEIEKMQTILKAVSIESTTANAVELFKQYIVRGVIVKSTGDVISDDVQKAFAIDMKKQYDLPVEKRHLPVFIFKKEGVGEKIILPIRGKGMWGPIWGYIALNTDKNTIYGATFGNKGETPGLGAEISTAKFQAQFPGKQIFDKRGQFTSLKLQKGTAKGHAHEFDAVSGGTVTSKGLEAMLRNSLGSYVKYLKSSK